MDFRGHYSAQYSLFSFILPSHQHRAHNELERKGAWATLESQALGDCVQEAEEALGTSRLFDNMPLSVPVELPLPIPHRQSGFGSQ